MGTGPKQQLIKKEKSPRQKAATELVLHSATKPFNVLLPTAIIAAGIVMGLPSIIVFGLGILIWMITSVMTFFNAEEATKLGQARQQQQLENKTQKISPDSPVYNTYKKIEQKYNEIIMMMSENDHQIPGLEKEVENIRELAYKSSLRAQRLHKIVDTQELTNIQYRINQLNKKDGLTQGETELKEALKLEETNIQKAQNQLEEYNIKMERLAVELSSVCSSIATSTSVNETINEEELVDQAKYLKEKIAIMTEELV